MTQDYIQEAAAAVEQVVGLSAYLHGVNYSVEKFRQELEAMSSFMKTRAPTGAR